MTQDDTGRQYGTRFRIFAGLLSALIVLGNLYVLYLESRLPFDFYIHIAVMILCSILLVHVFCHIAFTGNRPGYMQPGDNEKSEEDE